MNSCRRPVKYNDVIIEVEMWKRGVVFFFATLSIPCYIVIHVAAHLRLFELINSAYMTTVRVPRNIIITIIAITIRFTPRDQGDKLL